MGGIQLQNDSAISISVGASRKSTSWTVLNIKVSELYERLSSPIRGVETVAEYLKLPKATQDNLKDVGGFVGGRLAGPRRKPENIIDRTLVTLDFDTVAPYGTPLITEKLETLGCGYCIYSTRKHRPEAPRLRVVIPLDRSVSPDEYDAVARFIAGQIGIAMCDPTTFEVARLMYWSSCCKDSDVVFKYADKPLLPVDRVLENYTDWRDYSERPQVPGEAAEAKRQAVKQGDPEGKPGVVGAFNRVYDIYAAMDKFLPGVYLPCAAGSTDPTTGLSDRYTFAGGSTTGGAVIYGGGKFLYSHHATDPCGGKLVNAFDMVRLHKFKDEDDSAPMGTPVNRLPSYKSMCEFAVADKSVAALIASERAEAAVKEFQGVAAHISAQSTENAENEHFSEGSDVVETPTDWMQTLQIDPKSGRVLGTIDNILKILDNDPLLKDKFALNDFAGQVEVRGLLPWCTDARRRMWSDTDSNGAYWYMERVYNITGRGNIDAALDVHASTHQFNEVQDYLKSLTWDGVPRLDTLFTDYLGAADTEYNRAVCRKAFVAGVARAMTPGCKYDNMVILSGAQGIGKSTLIERMAKGWFTGNIHSFEGKDASELLKGVWLVEIAELEALRKTDVARVKQFLSLRSDRYRAAYGRNVQELPRRCVFFGTCNLKTFLQDTTGNRRFLPVDVGVVPHSKSAFELKQDEINQLWAEAKARWQMGESLFLTGKLAEEAAERQEGHREVSAKEPMVVDFVYKMVPQDWLSWDISKRRDYWAGQVRGEFKLVPRDRICAQEVWCELFNGDIKACDKQTKREIDGILGSLIGYQYKPEPVRFGPYGLARGGYVTASYHSAK